MQKIIEVKGGVVRHPQMRMGAPIDFELLAGEQLAIVGDNGSGKTRLVDVLTGKCALMPMQEVKYDFAPSRAKMGRRRGCITISSAGTRMTSRRRRW